MKITKFTIAGAALALFGAASAASAETFIRWSDATPNRGDRAEHYMWIASELESRSGGAISTDFQWAGALLDLRSALEGVGTGAADMATIIGAFAPGELNAYTVTDLPTEISDPWVNMRAAYELATTHPAMIQMFEELNIHYVTNVTTTASHLICRDRHITTLDDLQDVRVRSVGIYGRILADLGAEVVRMGQGDVYQALDTGVVDCNQNYAYIIPIFKQQEVAPFLTRMDWGQFLAFGLVMNRDTYNAMSDDERAVLNEVGSEAIDIFGERMVTATADSLELLASEGVEIQPMDPAELDRLNEASQPFITAWIEAADEAGLPGQDLYDTYSALLQKYEGIRVEQGYPWTQ